MHTPSHKHLTHQYKHHQQEQEQVSYANPHIRSNHTKHASHLLSLKYFVNLQKLQILSATGVITQPACFYSKMMTLTSKKEQ